MSPPREDKGAVKKYISNVTGMSRAQITQLISRYVASGTVEVRRGRGKRFTVHYTPSDIALLAEVEEPHETLSGPATRKICGSSGKSLLFL
jgi:DNA-binding MarR family transcriptional regulator